MSVQALNLRNNAATYVPGSGDYKSPSKAELEDLADKLHDVGEKKAKKDDYDRRLEALASEFLPTLSPEDRGRFIGTVMEKDKGALDSWLQKGRLDKLVDSGRIEDADRKRVLDGVSRGFGDDHIPKDKAAEFVDTGRKPEPQPEPAPPKDDKPSEPPKDILKDGFREFGKNDRVVYDDIQNVSYPGEYQDGWLRFETKDGGKFAVDRASAPGAYALAERKYLDAGQQTIDNARDRAKLDPTAKTDVFSLETSEEVDGHKLKVGDAAMKLMIDEIKGKKDLFDGSPQAEFLRMVEARSAVTHGKFVHPVYENRHINVGGRTKTETENLLKLEPADMKEMLDEGKINQRLDALMRDEQVSALYQKSLQEAVGKVPEEERKSMADQLAKVVESSDYVQEIGKLPKWDQPRAQADVEDAISQLGLLDPDRAKSAGQKFAMNALARDIDAGLADGEFTPEAEVDGVEAGLGAVTNAMEKAKLPVDLADGIDEFLDKGGDAAKRDFAQVAKELRAEGYAPEDIDKAFSRVDFQSDKKDTIRGLIGQLDSSGLLPSVTGAIGIASTVRGLVKDGFGETPEEKLAVAGGLIGMVGSLQDAHKLLSNLGKGIDGSALDLLGVDKAVKDNIGVDTRYGNQAVSAVGGNVAAADIPPTDIANRDQIVKGIEQTAGDPAKGSLSRISASTLKVLSDYSGKAGGVLGVVTGGMGAAEAFKGDSSPAEKAEAVLGVVSGTLELAPDVLKAGSKFVSAVGGQAAGAVAERVVGAITRGLGPVGMLLSVASELVSVFVNNAKDKKEAKEQYEWFSKLGEDGVTQGDWNLKYDYAVTTLNSFGNARDYINNLRELRGADWGGRQAPGDRSIFDFHREEFADFKSKWEKDRGADTYVEFLDADKRKADFKREKDHMDEVKEYMDKHPTYFPGYNDWVLEL
ncbi:hypothetical protein J5226_01425 [Lysobacter sp. K5869]|uniref:hypothetical protein n=1 Tax=Lysobacter sp. K5869 TaxID=2820808 RepID=UPI001C06320D|nr:hypothetical protein [Lysobacter sp. K5869]QWP77095.1 hypothetical protein J5226_01425 [Lysobacter sp. K5869]